MIKIDIVSGFLGAGKTTFIKKILKELSKTEEKIVIIENEFGEAGIDGRLIRDDDFKVYEITKGCICCTLKEDFINTLGSIMQMDKPDRIIFEPSGIFIPDVILEQLKGYELSEGCRLNSMVTIIDSVKYLSQREKYGFFFESQIKHASTMLLSKTDNVSRENIDEIKKNLFKINKGADIVSSAWDKLSLADILMILDGNAKYMPDTGTENTNHLKILDFESTALYTGLEYTKENLKSRLLKLASGDCGEIVRLKGILKQKNGSIDINYVDGDYEITDNTYEIDGGIVSIIGLNLNIRYIRSIFNQNK